MVGTNFSPKKCGLTKVESPEEVLKKCAVRITRLFQSTGLHLWGLETNCLKTRITFFTMYLWWFWIELSLTLSIQDNQMKVHVDNCCFMTSLPSSVEFRQHFTSESKIRTWSTPKYITPCLISEFEYTSNAFDIRVNSFSSKIRFLTSMLYINTTNQVLST